VNLHEFGFTRTESDVFRALITAGPSTGYAVAKASGIARANTYQALEALRRRGLIEARAGRPVVFAARSPVEVIATLEREFRSSAEGLAKELADLRSESGPGHPWVEEVSGLDGVLGAASRCAAAARREFLAVVSPWARPVFAEFERVALRGAGARLLALGRPAPQGALLREVPERELAAYWGGAPLLVVSDGLAAVAAVRSPGGASGVAARHPGLVPFLRHVLRRELSAAAAQAVT
jgi:sugar-specific transcriptional regulator TrmB